MGYRRSSARLAGGGGTGFFALTALVVAFAGVAACAEGAADPGLGLETNEDPTDPPPSKDSGPSSPLPGPSDDDDSGSTSSSSGGSSSGGIDAGVDSAVDATVDAAKDATVDATVDAGTCATVPPSNACGLAPQCGCAANQTCDVTNTTSGAVSCVLAGGGTLGNFCTATTQCAKGLTCQYNACRPPCPTIGAACVGTNVGVCAPVYDPVTGATLTNVKACTIACDLRNPSAVCGSNNCIWDTSVNQPDCDRSGTVGQFGACDSYNDCQQGMACINHPLFGFECEKWCRIGSSDCGVLGSCEDVYGAAAPMSGGVKLGHCQ